MLDPEEVAQSRFGGDKYGDDITLDVEARESDELTQSDLETAIEEAKQAAAAAQAGQQPASPVPEPVAGLNNPDTNDALNGAQVQELVKDALKLVSEMKSRIDEIEKRGQREDFIEEREGEWLVLSKAGKILGRHKTKKAAKKQLRAIEASKAE